MNYFLGCSLLDKTCTSPFSHLSAIGSDYFNIGKENHVELIQNNSGNELIKLAERFITLVAKYKMYKLQNNFLIRKYMTVKEDIN